MSSAHAAENHSDSSSKSSAERSPAFVPCPLPARVGHPPPWSARLPETLQDGADGFDGIVPDYVAIDAPAFLRRKQLVCNLVRGTDPHKRGSEEVLNRSARNELSYPACHSLRVVCDFDVLDQGFDVRVTS